MKKIIFCFMALGLILQGGRARADEHALIINEVIKVNNTQCAVEMRITENDQDKIDETETLWVGSTLINNFGGLPTGFHDDNGDRFLIASESFTAAIADHIIEDFSFADSICAEFDADAEFAFVFANTLAGDMLNAADVPGFGGDATGIRDESGHSPSLIDLSTASLPITNNAGVTVPITVENGVLIVTSGGHDGDDDDNDIDDDDNDIDDDDNDIDDDDDDGVPGAAHDGLYISHVVLLEDGQCAIELKFWKNDQNEFQENELLALDGTTLVEVGDFAVHLNHPDSNNDIGDHIFAASHAFQNRFGSIDADLLFDDSFCESFDQDASFEYNINHDERVYRLMVTDVPGFDENNEAIDNSDDGEWDLVNLNNGAVLLFNNDGDALLVGGADADIDADIDVDGSVSAEGGGDGDDGFFDCSVNVGTTGGVFNLMGAGATSFALALALLGARRGSRG